MRADETKAVSHRTQNRSVDRVRPARPSKWANATDPMRLRRIRTALMKWSRTGGRRFFWRNGAPDPFAVLVTEILLTKTRAELVEPIALELIRRFGSPAGLAKASHTELETLLYPLGLHRKRAKNLVACATSLLRDHGAQVPSSIPDLMSLPSVGRYAAHAVASVAFHRAVPVVDANVARIFHRVFSMGPVPDRLSTAHDWWELAERLLPRAGAKQFNWALLDLGGTVCLPRNPACVRCPISRSCDFARLSRRTS